VFLHPRNGLVLAHRRYLGGAETEAAAEQMHEICG
jgi:hypothetical protein